MSNEELAVQIQNGAPERMGELWTQVEGLVKWKARRIMTALELRGNVCGVDFDDLVQCGFPALVAAVNTYDLESGAFSTWLMYYLQKEFAEVTGYRTKREQNEPLNNSVCLDQPLSDDPEAATIGDMIPDPKATAAMEWIEETVWRDQLHGALETMLRELHEDQSRILRRRYYANESLVETGEFTGMPSEQVRKLENMGLRALRRLPGIERIRKFYISD